MPIHNCGSNGKGKSFSSHKDSSRFSRLEKSPSLDTKKGDRDSRYNNDKLDNRDNKATRMLSGFVKTLAPVIFVILSLVICIANADARQLVFGLDTTPERLLPIKIKSPQTFPVSMQIYEGLFDVDEAGKVIPRVIEKWETEDYQTWIFHVRKGVYFHSSSIFKNGTREVTADDVLYSLTRFCSADSYSSFLLLDYLKGAADYNQGKAEKVKGLKVLGPHRLQVTLSRPVPFFINHISSPVLAVFPKEIDQKKYEKEAGLSMAVGTGPFVFQSMSETEVVLSRNDNYWDKQNIPAIEEIRFQVIKHDQARLASLRRGRIDLMVLPSNLFSAVFDSSGNLKSGFVENYQVKSIPTFNSHLIGINNKAIKDENLRKAMFWATDRRRMAESILNGYADITGGTVPPGLNNYQPPFDGSFYDLDKAKRYLEKSSYEGEPIELMVHDLANSELIGQIFQSQMGKIGINIDLTRMDYDSVIGRMIKGDAELFSMFFEYAFSSPEPILINLFSTGKIPAPNFFQFSDDAVDEMIEKLYEIPDAEKRVNFCAEIEAEVTKRVPAIFLYQQKYMILYSKDLSDLEVSGNNHYFLEKLRFTK